MEVRIFEAENQIYQKERLLGEGAFGKAYLVRKKQTGELLVVKEVNVEQMSQQQREQTIKEAQILRNLKHPLIVRFVQVYATKQNKLKIVMEYAQCGDLSKAIATQRDQKKVFQENQILDWFTQICLAMKHVHDRKILHRDLKGQNIFITKANTIKLGDFGIAKVLNKTQDKARTFVGTPYYLSPQIIQNKPYSFKSDVWSMGVLLYQLCALSPPFTANSLQFLALKIVKGSYSQLGGNYSKQLKGLVAELLQIDPKKRPSVADILKKPILHDRIRKYLSQTCRKNQFSHTILHNQKIQIANNMIKKQEEIEGAEDIEDIDQERNKLKQSAAILKEKMERKKKEEQILKEEQKNRRKRQQDLKKQLELQKKKQIQQKMRQAQQKQAIQQRKQWAQQKKIQQKQNIIQIGDRRGPNYTQIAQKKQIQQPQLQNKRQKLQQEKYEMQRIRRSMDEQYNKRQTKDIDSKNISEFNDFARKQWHQNRMIREKAKERAQQFSMQDLNQLKGSNIAFQKPQSNKIIKATQFQHKNNCINLKNYSSIQYQLTEQELQSQLLNPKFNKNISVLAIKKQPEARQRTKSNVNGIPNSSNQVQKNKEPNKFKQQQSKIVSKKSAYEENRQKMKKDRQQFLKNRAPKAEESVYNANKYQLKPGKAETKTRQKSQQPTSYSNMNRNESFSSKQNPSNISGSNIKTREFGVGAKSPQQFSDQLNELQELLGNVINNVEKLPVAQTPLAYEKIVMREDDNKELDYTITQSFDNPSEQMDTENVDLDCFQSYQKLEDLKMLLEDQFGTEDFIKIYRALEGELQQKGGLQNLNIIELVQSLSDIVDSQLITQYLPLLITLIVMEQKMSNS